jgi:uncharacterized caspase-like protein
MHQPATLRLPARITARAVIRLCAASLLLLVLLMLPAQPALAERRVALVIGIDRYEAVRPLKNAVNDAETIAGLLRALDFEVEVEPDRDLRRLRRALEDFREDAAGADFAVIFFAGHGVEIDGRNMLLPADVQIDSLDAVSDSALPLEEIVATARAVAPNALILLDACRDDPFGASGGGALPDGTRGATGLLLPGATGPIAVRPGLSRVGRADGLVFAFAAAPGATAADGAGANSPFTQALARHLGTPGIELRSALTLVQQDVYDRARGRQLPYVEAALPRPVFLAPDAEDLPERARLLLAMAGIDATLRARVETAAAGADIPLAPLYASVLAQPSPDSLDDLWLAEAAHGIAETRRTLLMSAATDPVATALRTEAAEALELGAFELARARIDEAIARDRQAGDAALSVLIARRLAEADSLRVRADLIYAGGWQEGDEGFTPAYVRAARAYRAVDDLARDNGLALDPDALRRAIYAAERATSLSAWLLTHGAPPDRDAMLQDVGYLLDLLERLGPVPGDPAAVFQDREYDYLEGVLYAIGQHWSVWDTEVIWETDENGFETGTFVTVDRGLFNTDAVMALRQRALSWAEAFDRAGRGIPHPWAGAGIDIGTHALIETLDRLAFAHDERGEAAQAAEARARASALRGQ